ncbi:SMI1/KNR4 family protein [Paenibacillus paeoniae]|uniref:SMI1/KNR4 family protein n=1 Tax=Paenibacillus paeoniae TaxID=2292705 RepID=A0A371PLG4_9BACL|nr:SMI1/KNR4 family protein [Paenibacillus paeoniae]REK76825.1 SMI1/KNR4 family protein [Paenibacillus paeoniae]
MAGKMDEFINWADENGWDLIKKSEFQLHLDSSITARYKEIPNEYLDFLRVVGKCVSPNEMTWFICEDEFNNRSDTEFKWNEFEWTSLAAASDDQNWQSEITAWWDHYLPIVMSVNGGYCYYAIDLTYDKGAIVRGCEPEFEEVEKVANHLDHFFELIMSNAIEV